MPGHGRIACTVMISSGYRGKLFVNSHCDRSKNVDVIMKKPKQSVKDV